MSDRIHQFQSTNVDARAAVREFRDGVWQPNAALVLFFCSSAYPLEDIAEEMGRQFPDVQVVGCTTAGEIGPAGYLDHTISGASFPSGSFSAVGGLLSDLAHFEFSSARAFVQARLQELEASTKNSHRTNSFALMLIDGLSSREEPVTRALQSALGDIPLVGGSAGDGLNFDQTFVYFDGRFHSDAAAVVLMATPRAISTFKIQNFVPMEERLVVTEADADHRLVREINGLPAAEEYARVIGAEPGSLTPECFAASPVVVLVDGSNYVRAIRTANQDNSLTFYCAIDEGMVLRVAEGTDLVANMSDAFEQIRTEIGIPDIVVGFDCILRKLNIFRGGLGDSVDAVLRQNNTVGFSTYGEQYRGVHINQTLTGIAIGGSPAGVADG